MRLSRDEYIDILKYYGTQFDISASKKILRIMCEKIIAEKLCRCIKKIQNVNPDEPRAIAICNNSVVLKKHLRIHGFTCKKKRELKEGNNKGSKGKLMKSEPYLKLNSRKKNRKKRNKKE